MFIKAGMHHRNVYVKKYDKLAHLITHKMPWSFQRQASVISIKTVNYTLSLSTLQNKIKFLESFLSAVRSQFILASLLNVRSHSALVTGTAIMSWYIFRNSTN